MATCQSDGKCAPIRCNAGHVCPEDSRCNVDSARADTFGCEKLPCDDGWTCEKNTRCTAPAEVGGHGCTPLPCAGDCDCDSGYCVNGACASSLGLCSSAPQ